MEDDRAKILADLEKSTESAAEKCSENETLLAATLKILEQLKSGKCNTVALTVIMFGRDFILPHSMIIKQKTLFFLHIRDRFCFIPYS